MEKEDHAPEHKRQREQDRGKHRRVFGALPERPRLRRKRRSGLRKDHRHQEDVAEVEAGQDEAGNDRALVDVADRTPELIGHDDEHEARRDDLRKRARSGDRAARHAPVIAVAQHDRQRDQAHRDDRCGDDAGRGGKQRTDADHRIGDTAADRAKKLAGGVEQLFRHARSFEDQPHEGEERDREQRLVRHDAPDAIGKRLQEASGGKGRARCRGCAKLSPTKESAKATG